MPQPSLKNHAKESAPFKKSILELDGSESESNPYLDLSTLKLKDYMDLIPNQNTNIDTELEEDWASENVHIADVEILLDHVFESQEPDMPFYFLRHKLDKQYMNILRYVHLCWQDTHESVLVRLDTEIYSVDIEAIEEQLFNHPDPYDLNETEHVDDALRRDHTVIQSLDTFDIMEFIKLEEPALKELILNVDSQGPGAQSSVEKKGVEKEMTVIIMPTVGMRHEAHILEAEGNHTRQHKEAEEHTFQPLPHPNPHIIPDSQFILHFTYTKCLDLKTCHEQVAKIGNSLLSWLKDPILNSDPGTLTRHKQRQSFVNMQTQKFGSREQRMLGVFLLAGLAPAITLNASDPEEFPLPNLSSCFMYTQGVSATDGSLETLYYALAHRHDF
ncbi:hypothetical protein CPB84DRAFT_1752863 [Gymnopilus junonius]|uniref:Uncharacterized protein n=1 Tax=Gymnopilus junonius TaxID=109634 RepID=A0A9P5N8N7_GYMJU|nr:hypothetical protein CPB84DRAFT_1752863 [Gymnopilus junonius]